MCSPVSITAKPMMMRRMLRWVSMPHRPISDRQQPVISRMVETGKPMLMRAPRSASEPVDDDAQFRADLDTEQRGNQRNGAGAEERAEFAARQKARVEKTAREYEAQKPDTYVNHAGKRFDDAQQ